MTEKQNIRLWVDALRSDDYDQTTGYLKDDTGYCCLGVACDISGLTQWSFHGENSTWTYYTLAGRMPANVKNWLEIDNNIDHLSAWSGTLPPPFNKSNGFALSLATLNDDGFTFNQIADIIEYVWL